MFLIIDKTLQRFPLSYVQEWTPTFLHRTDQRFMTQLTMNPPVLDLPERFNTRLATVYNIIITHIFALHEIFYEGMIEGQILSLLKCKGSRHASTSLHIQQL